MNPRAALGPLVIGVSIWCAAGTVAPVTIEQPGIRLGWPAPWWVLLLGAIAAAPVPAWRRHPATALPALLSTLPWWPVLLPAIGLLFTGPLAWLPVLVSAVAAVTRSAAAARAEAGSGRTPPAWRWTAAAGIATTAAALAAWISAMPRVPGGDEPHYLVITQSLLRDGDLRVQNNHERGDYREYFGGTLTPDYVAKSRTGAIYSIHAPGVPALVAPAFAAAGYPGAAVFFILLAGVTGALVWAAAHRVTRSRAAATFAWAAVTMTPTFLVQGFTIFPDLPGALVVALCVYVAAGGWPSQGACVSTRGLLAAGVALAALPWFHTRFAVIALGLGLVLTALVWQDAYRDRPQRAQRLAVLLGLPAASALSWFLFFWTIYGTPDPRAAYGGDLSRIANIPGGLAAIVFDAQFGLLPYAPALAFALAGLTRRSLGGASRLGWALALVALAYLALTTSVWMWWAGRPAPPARFVTAVLPIAALPLALGWQSASPPGRLARVFVLAVSVATTLVVVGVDRAALAWNDRDAHAAWLEWLGPVVDLPRGLPSFFWRLDPADLASEGPFLLHIGALIVTVAAFASAASAAIRRWPSAASPLIAWTLTLGLAASVQVGWWLNGSPGLDPARAQLAGLTRTSGGQAGWRIAPLPVGLDRDGAAALRITSETPGVISATPPWGVWRSVPPGAYAVEVMSARPARGSVTVRVGREPPRTVALAPLSVQSIDVVVSGQASAVVVLPDPSLAGLRATAVLTRRYTR
jgi:hypothetical protein